MKRQRGFTLIEILVVIVIMGILLLLSVVNLRSTQAQARDQKRAIDIANIARQFEKLYSSGATSTSGYQGPVGSYPSTTSITNNSTSGVFYGMDTKNLYAPNVDPAGAMSLQAASVTGAQNPTIDQYIYVPYAFDSSGASVLCTDTTTQSCRRFELYYRTEVSATVIKVDSKNQ